MKLRWLVLMLLASVVLVACSDNRPPEQPEAGDGWEFVLTERTSWSAPGSSAVFTTREELDPILRTILPTVQPEDVEVDFESQVVLALTSDDDQQVFLDILFSTDSITVDRWVSDGNVTLDAAPTVSLFVLDRASLPTSNPFDIVRTTGQPTRSIRLPEGE